MPNPTLLQTLATTARVLEDAARQLRAVTESLAVTAQTASVRCARCAEWLSFDRVRLLPPVPGVPGPEAVCHACLADERNPPVRACDVIGECDDCKLSRANVGVDARREDDACERAAGRDW